MKSNYLNIVFVIDESGSMEGSNADVIGGFNTYIEKHRNLPETRVTVSLYKFNQQITQVITNLPVAEVRNLTPNDYTPASFTALLDAIGHALTNTDNFIANLPETERPTANLMVIITDGEENASRNYSVTALKAAIATHEKQLHWQFIYLGADLSNFDDALELGINNHISFDKKNMQQKFESVADASIQYMCNDILNFEIESLMEELED